MFARVHFPESLSAEGLDHYLAQGWFRMGQSIFTTNFLSFKDQLYSAIWLRVDLHKFANDKTQQELLKRNRKFKTEIKPSNLTWQHEQLYSQYKKGISFDASPTLNQLLFRNAAHSIFNTYEVNIYDEDKLIASGFFDLGEHSAEGIVSIYDPAYKKYSLGKYLIYQKIMFCKESGLDYFYPGYFVPGYSFFDYKLSIGKPAIEFLKYETSQWLPIQDFNPEETPLRQLTRKLQVLQQTLGAYGIQSKIMRYAYFDAGLIPELKDADLFDYPVFLLPETNNEFQLIVFDIVDHCYRVLECESLWISPGDNENPELYAKHLLRVRQNITTVNAAEDFVKNFAANLRTGT